MKFAHGFSLIEILVSLIIGLVLLFGLSSAFIATRQTFNLRQNMAFTQNNERIAVQFLSAAVRHAGSVPNPLTQVPPIHPITGTGANAGADTLTVKYWAEPYMANQGCSAQLIPNHLYTDTFSVAGGYLSCTETDSSVSPPTSTTVNLIGGPSGSNNQLTGLNIIYGIDPLGSGSVSQYANATVVSDWSTVKTVTFTLLFDAPLANKENQTVNTFSLTQTVPYMIGL